MISTQLQSQAAHTRQTGVMQRLIPVVMVRDGVAVQSKGFRRFQALGDPTTVVERLSRYAADELIYLDITPPSRRDLGATRALVERLAPRSRMPLTFGGGITDAAQAVELVRLGADKICMTTAAIDHPERITATVRELGTQCVVVGIDASLRDGRCVALADNGARETGRDAIEWAIEAADRGAGEILLHASDRDGAGTGYDLDLIGRVASTVPIPVVALGGAGRLPETGPHCAAALQAGASAAAVGNAFNYAEHSVLKTKRYLHEQGLHVRPATFLHGEGRDEG